MADTAANGRFVWQGQQKTYQAINTGLLETYWEIGKHIVEFEQQGSATAEYGAGLLKQLSRDLKAQHGKGFSLSNLKRFRQFYLLYRKGATVSHLLTWSHYVELHGQPTLCTQIPTIFAQRI